MRNAIAFCTTGAFVTLLTPPVGKKYEVLNVAMSQYVGTAVVWRPALNFLGLIELYLDEFGVGAGVVAANRSYQSILIPAGSTFDIGEVAATPVGGVAIVTYMDVDL